MKINSRVYRRLLPCLFILSLTLMALAQTPQPSQSGNVLLGANLSAGYDMGVNSSGNKTDWLESDVKNGHFKMAYPAAQSWGAVFIVYEELQPEPPPPRPKNTNLSSFKTLSIEMKGESGGEEVYIGIKSNEQRDNGRETKVRVNLTSNWKIYNFPLDKFVGADLTKLYVVAEFVFMGPVARTIYVRKVEYQNEPTPTRSALPGLPQQQSTTTSSKSTADPGLEVKPKNENGMNSEGGSYALIIGVGRYNNGWPNLPGVYEDIEPVRSVLAEYGFQVATVRDPDHLNLEKAYKDFIDKYGLDPRNRILIYFTGHGHTLEQEYGGMEGYIVPADAPDPFKDQSGFRARAMAMTFIEAYARKIQSKHALFLFDSCFSGSLFEVMRGLPTPGVITAKTAYPVRQFITAGSATQQVPDQSIFRREFVNGLKGAADMDRDGYITGEELCWLLGSSVSNYSNASQTPVCGKMRDPRLDKGDFVFKRESEEPRPEYPFFLETKFYPSGWMGDGESGTKYLSYGHDKVQIDGQNTLAIRIEYNKGGPEGWAGIYWQYPLYNWGDSPGRSLTGAKRVTFYAKGERGDEVVRFKAGGINKGGSKYRDSFVKSLENRRLSTKWTKYSIDLAGEDLSNVIGAFAWVSSFADNKDKIIFYIAKLIIE